MTSERMEWLALAEAFEWGAKAYRRIRDRQGAEEMERFATHCRERARKLPICRFPVVPTRAA